MTSYIGTIVMYDAWKKNMVEAANLSSDVFKMGLTSSAYTPNVSTHAVLADITNEVSGGGYARQTLGGVTSSQSGGVYTFNVSGPVFTATLGTIVSRYWFIFNDTVTSPLKPLVCYGLIDQGGGDVTITDGNILTITVNATGLFTIS